MSSQQKPYPSLHLKSRLPRNAGAALQIQTSLQKLPAEVYVEVEVEAEAGLQEHTRLHDHAVTTSLHLICLFSIYPVCAQHCHGSYTLFLFFVSVKEHPSHVCVKEWNESS